MSSQNTISPEPSAGARATSAASVESEDLPHDVRTLLPLCYQHLKRLARRERGKLQPHSTLNTTAVVHEVYLSLGDDAAFSSREHFLRTFVVACRYIIIDRIRSQLADKRGGKLSRADWEDAESEVFLVENAVETLAVHDALTSLQSLSPRLAQVVECRYFGGYADAETAEALGLSLRTVRRDWSVAKAWLARELAVAER